MTDELDPGNQHARLQAQWRKAAAKKRAKRAAQRTPRRGRTVDPMTALGWRRSPSGGWVPR